MQKKGAGFYAGTSVYWDNENDGKECFSALCIKLTCNLFLLASASYRYETKTLYAVVNVFALSL